ncbi:MULTISPECIES: chemotaxis protein CheW [Caballeronia]|jgi:chemotaxis-related protein WspB|uniref:Chemotaxis protein CheW n=1 Tax=Caballeronia zhejiangensis TaxID=871203 RepID=A0A656Q9A7_9BURK|nr:MULTISPECIES: chemotaxis protein CheW [Caballeronia]EKS66235.1 CheW protein [Burkholderia sp. SJ98]KDR25209.1 chemotaxis protein CheW [Caballeronia zhejiangensis]MDR5789202.1 chemotaxis protein CheW [Caballeronia sp. LP003]MDR5797853.1 chemotaxis protein CheW [Caballeronia sp. LZ008]
MLFVQFTLDADRYLLDSAQVERMLPLAPLKTLPGAPAWVAGVLDCEGANVPVIDLAALALARASHERVSTRLALVAYPRCGDDGAIKHHRLGLLLEQATRTVTFDAASFTDAGIDTPHARYLGPLARDERGLLQWVRIEHLLPDDVQTLLFAGSEA